MSEPAASPDRELLQRARDWLNAGREVALVTVLRTWGSSPRPPGSLLIMCRDGSHAGSVSGGCVEEDLLARYGSGELGGLPTRLDYGVNREEAARFGLPCGGRLELLVESLADIDHLDTLIAAMDAYRLTAREIDLDSGAVRLRAAGPELEFSLSETALVRGFGPTWRMLLIGAGHLSQYVARMGLMLGYEVMVCDPRAETARDWQEPGTRLVGLMPDDAVQELAGHERSIILALTHDPKLDDLALLEALDSEAFYVGAIGSQRNCELRRGRLRELGVSETKLQRLRAPVGLPIGSHTPPEIAVSILAEITARRNAAAAGSASTATTAA